MPRSLSENLRKRIVKKREEGYSEAEVSELFGVSPSSVYRFFKRQREGDDLRPKKMGRPEGAKLAPHKERILGWIKGEPGLTLEELPGRLASEADVHVHSTTVIRTLSRWGYRCKKSSLREGTKSRGRPRNTHTLEKAPATLGLPQARVH